MQGSFVHRGVAGYDWCAVDIAVAGPPDPRQWADCALPVAAEDFDLRFVWFEEGGFAEIDGSLAYERPFFVEVRFARDQEVAFHDVELRWGETGVNTVGVRQSPDDAALYRSEEIVIMDIDPASSPEGDRGMEARPQP